MTKKLIGPHADEIMKLKRELKELDEATHAPKISHIREVAFGGQFKLFYKWRRARTLADLNFQRGLRRLEMKRIKAAKSAA
jgi:hypothetical protein